MKSKNVTRGQIITILFDSPSNWICLLFSNLRPVVEAQELSREGQNIVHGFFRTLELVHKNGGGLYGLGSISTIDLKFNLWGLENNIILDANCEIDHRYQLRDSFLIDRQTAVFKHDKWTMHHINFNTSKSNIGHHPEYFEKVIEQIKQRQRSNDKTLVVTHKDYESKVCDLLKEAPNVDVTYFGNLLGRNTWRDYTQVWIIGTNNYNYTAYPLQGLGRQGRHYRMSSIMF